MNTLRGRCAWFSAVVLFVLLSAAGVQHASPRASAGNGVELCGERTSHAVADVARMCVRHGPSGGVTRAPALPRPQPRWLAVVSYGLPAPRAPTS